MEIKEKDFFDKINNIKGIENLPFPITDYFLYREHPGIPVYFKPEMVLPEDIRSQIITIQSQTISF